MLNDYYVDFKNISQVFNDYCNGEEGLINNCNNVIDYLNNLDMQLIKAIKIILHIGKNENNNCIHTPHELYKKTMNSFDILRGWKDKETEINSISIDSSISKYFDNGLEILKMK